MPEDQSQAQPSEANELSEAMEHKLYGKRFQKALTRAIDSGDIDGTDRRILYRIAQFGTWTVKGLAEYMGYTPGTISRRINKPPMQKLIDQLEGTIDSLMLHAARQGAKRIVDLIEDPVSGKEGNDAAKFSLGYVAKRIETEAGRVVSELPSTQEAIDILQADPALSDDDVIDVTPLDEPPLEDAKKPEST